MLITDESNREHHPASLLAVLKDPLIESTIESLQNMTENASETLFLGRTLLERLVCPLALWLRMSPLQRFCYRISLSLIASVGIVCFVGLGQFYVLGWRAQQMLQNDRHLQQARLIEGQRLGYFRLPEQDLFSQEAIHEEGEWMVEDEEEGLEDLPLSSTSLVPKKTQPSLWRFFFQIDFSDRFIKDISHLIEQFLPAGSVSDYKVHHLPGGKDVRFFIDNAQIGVFRAQLAKMYTERWAQWHHQGSEHPDYTWYRVSPRVQLPAGQSKVVIWIMSQQ